MGGERGTTGSGVGGRRAQFAATIVLDDHLRPRVAVDRLRPGDGEIDHAPRALAGEVRRPDLGADVGAAVAAGLRVVGDVCGDRHVDDRDAAVARDDDVIFAGLADGLAAYLPGDRPFDHRAAARPRAVEEAEILGFSGVRRKREKADGEASEGNSNTHNFTQHIYLSAHPRWLKSLAGTAAKLWPHYRNPPRKRC